VTVESDATQAELQDLVHRQLVALGEDPQRPGLERTPLRVAKSLQFLTRGYSQDVESILNGAIFPAERADEMVVVRDIEFFSLCEHHLLPFAGKAHVAYLPDGKIVGLSKIPRLLDMYARRLQVQERLTVQLAEAIQAALGAKGVGVILEARHFCMMMRGVQKQDSYTTTSCMLGYFKTDAKTRTEFLALTGRRSIL
jgi:GTP cyclohydrolase I